jgi:rubredoxin
MSQNCPKCGIQKNAESCPRCGLVFTKYSPEAIEEEVSSEVRQLWQQVEDDWENSERHAVFMERAILAQAGGYAAACYRRRGDDPVALAQLEKISGRLAQILQFSATQPQKKSHGRLIGFLVLCFFLILIGMFALSEMSVG